MNNSHFNCLRLNLCQESQKPSDLSRDFSQPIRSGSETDRQRDARLYEGPQSIGVWTLKIIKIINNRIIENLKQKCLVKLGSASEE